MSLQSWFSWERKRHCGLISQPIGLRLGTVLQKWTQRRAWRKTNGPKDTTTTPKLKCSIFFSVGFKIFFGCICLTFLRCVFSLYSVAEDTLCRFEMSENSCMQPSRQPWPFGPQCLSSPKETQWVSGQRDTRFINLQQRRKKKFIVTETKEHLITTNRSSSKLEIIWPLINCPKAAIFGNMWCFWILPFHNHRWRLRLHALNTLWFNEHNSFVNWRD